MKFALFSLLIGILAALSMATAIPQKTFIVSYPNNTPDSVLEEAKHAIVRAGGVITHEYKIIRGFAAKATDAAVETVRTLGEKFNAVIEEDGIATIQGGSSGASVSNNAGMVSIDF